MLDLTDLPSLVWCSILSKCAKPEASALLRVSKSVRDLALKYASYTPKLHIRLSHDLGHARSLIGHGLQLGPFRLVLVGSPAASRALNAHMAVEVLEQSLAGREGQLARIQALTLQDMQVSGLLPTSILRLLPHLQHLTLHSCDYTSDASYAHQSTLDRIPQTWCIRFNYDSSPGEGPSAQPTTASLAPPPGLQALNLRSISGKDTSSRLLYSLKELGPHVTSLRLSDVIDCQDRIQYGQVISHLSQHLTYLRQLDLGDMYWMMRQQETEALLCMHHLTHLTVSGFELKYSLAQHPCSWQHLCCTSWDGFLHVPSLAYLPLHSLTQPLLLTSGPRDEALRLESDGGISLCLGPTLYERNELSVMDPQLLARAVANVMQHGGVRWGDQVQRVLVWNGSEDQAPAFSAAICQVLPLLAGCPGKLELAYVCVTPGLLHCLHTHLAPSLQQLTLFTCHIDPEVCSALLPSLPALTRLTLTGHHYESPPPEEDVQALMTSLPGPLTMVVAKGWASVVQEVRDRCGPLPLLQLRALASTTCITPRGVFSFEEDSTCV